MCSSDLAGWAQQGRLKAVQQLTVEDSKGKLVGRVLGGFGASNMERQDLPYLEVRTTVLLQFDQMVFPVAVSKDRFYGGFGVWYELENCKGPGWVPFIEPANQYEQRSILPRIVVASPGQTVYAVIPNSIPKVLSFKSVNFFDSCSPGTASFNALPVQPVIDLLTEFTPPFSIKPENGTSK